MTNYTYRKVRCSVGANGKRFVTHYVILENGKRLDSFLKLSNARKVYGKISSKNQERPLLYHSSR